MPDDRAEAIHLLVAQWLIWARSDLILAQMAEDERILPEILAFHAQQAAEKALKALLIHVQVEFPRTHVIGPLLNLCEKAGFSAAETLYDALVLTRYAVASRYPSEADRVSRDEAREAALIASTVLAWVETQIEVGTQSLPSESQAQ